MNARRQTSAPAKRKKKSVKKKAPHVDPSMRIADILETIPDAAEIFAMHGLHCAGCQFQTSDTLEEGAVLHGMNEVKLQDLLGDLRTGLPESMKRPKIINVTKSAAEALRDMLSAEGKADWKLLVMTDDTGGFCMEFAETASKDHIVFGHDEVPAVEVLTTHLTLASIGGSTIDFREGRFKLDLPNAGGCGCEKKDG